MGLEELGIAVAAGGPLQWTITCARRCPLSLPAAMWPGPYQFTHMASHQAWYAAVNALFGRFRKFKVDYSVVPWATFTDPEVARVGLNEARRARRVLPMR